MKIASTRSDFATKVEIEEGLLRLAIEVRDLRRANRYTQAKLAKKVRTTQKIISKIESGDINIGFDLFSRIAKALSFNIFTYKQIFQFEMPAIMQFDNVADREERLSSSDSLQEICFSEERKITFATSNEGK